MDSCTASRPTNGSHQSAGTNYIRQSRSITNYPQLCYHPLSAYADEIQSSPKLIGTKALLPVALSAINSASNTVGRLLGTQGMNPREAAEMVDCVTVVADSVDKLQRLIKEIARDINGINLRWNLGNVRI